MAETTTITGERPMSKTRDEVIKEAKRMEEALLYSSKGHFEAAAFWRDFHLWIGVPMVLLSTIAGASALSHIDPNHLLAGILSIIVAALSGIATFLNPNEKVSAHMNAGNNYDGLMNEIRIFWAIDCWGDDSDQVLNERLKHYSSRKDHLNKTCPQVPSFAYKKAKRGIEDGEGLYKVDQVDPGSPS